MEIIGKGIKNGKLYSIERDNEMDIYRYYACLLCLFISKLPTFDITTNRDKSIIAKNIRVFTIIANSIICKYYNYEPIITIYLSKYMQMLEFYLSFPIFF